jgi:predicted PurR-regulated permease PerM
MGAMTDSNSFSARVFSLVSVGLLGIGLFLVLRPFLAPLLWAGLLALLLFPAAERLRRGLGGRKTLAALLLSVAVVLVVVIPAVMVVGMFVSQAGDLLNWLQASASQHHIERPSDVFAIPAVDRAVQWVSARLPMNADEIRAAVLSGVQQAVQTSLSLAGSAFAGALGVATSVVLSLFLFFFFVRDGEEMVRRGIAIVPMGERRKAHLVAHLSAVTRGVVLGSLATAIVQGALVGIAFAIVGLPSPIVFAVLAMVASLIPVVGATLVWVPAALVLASTGRAGASVFLIVWAVGLVHTSDNVIRPLFVSSRAKISTLPVFIGLFGGVSAFGPIGMFLGPVLMALALALLQFAEEARAETPLATADGTASVAEDPLAHHAVK